VAGWRQEELELGVERRGTGELVSLQASLTVDVFFRTSCVRCSRGVRAPYPYAHIQHLMLSEFVRDRLLFPFGTGISP
jgi:hypothetical protein